MHPSVPASLLIGLATIWSLFVVDMVVESGPSAGRTLVFVGHVLMRPGEPWGVWILAGLSAGAALGLGSALAYARGRRLEHRMAAELDARWEELSRRNVGLQARHASLRRRVSELRSHVTELTDRRDALVGELGDALVPATDADGERSVIDLAERRTKRRRR